MFQKAVKIAILFSVLSMELKSQTWQQIADFPATERDDGTTFTINNYVYCGTGLKTGFSICNDFYRFNTLTETWDTVAALPQFMERQYACGFSYNGNGYVFGGTGFGVLNDMWCYSPSSNSWTQLSSKPGLGLSGAACFVLNNKAYFVGGNNSATNASEEVWQYNISSDSWVKKNNFPSMGIWRANAATLNTKGYLLFGKDSLGNFNRNLYEYSEISDNWTPISNFPAKARTYASMQVLGNSLFVFGGIDSLAKYYTDFWQYSFDDSIWHSQAAMPAQGRKGGMAFSSGSAFYYTTGIDSLNTRLKESWKIENIISVNELNCFSSIQVFPNPCRDYFNINVPDKINYSLELLNCLGTIIWKKNVVEGQKQDISELRNGVYFLKIYNSEQFILKKLFIMN